MITDRRRISGREVRTTNAFRLQNPRLLYEDINKTFNSVYPASDRLRVEIGHDGKNLSGNGRVPTYTRFNSDISRSFKTGRTINRQWRAGDCRVWQLLSVEIFRRRRVLSQTDSLAV